MSIYSRQRARVSASLLSDSVRCKLQSSRAVMLRCAIKHLAIKHPTGHINNMSPCASGIYMSEPCLLFDQQRRQMVFGSELVRTAAKITNLGLRAAQADKGSCGC